MKQILRIEHFNGQGPFRSRPYTQYVGFFEQFNEFTIRYGEMNTMGVELERLHFTQEEISKHYCAFISLEQLQTWTTLDEINLMFRLGYSIILYEVTECIIVDNQCFFKHENVIAKTDISDLFQTQNLE